MASTYRTMQEIVYDTVREGILSGRYQPGARLIAEELAQEMGVSRMPVREALQRLEATGLVSIYPHRGAVVNELSRTEIVEVYHIRAVLEGLASRMACPNLGQDHFTRLHTFLDEMTEHAARQDMKQMLRCNQAFHEIIWEAANAPRLKDMIRTLYDTSQRYRNVSLTLPGRFVELVEEHRQIVEALERGDALAAERATNEHHENTALHLLHMVEESKERPS